MNSHPHIVSAVRGLRWSLYQNTFYQHLASRTALVRYCHQTIQQSEELLLSLPVSVAQNIVEGLVNVLPYQRVMHGQAVMPSLRLLKNWACQDDGFGHRIMAMVSAYLWLSRRAKTFIDQDPETTDIVLADQMSYHVYMAFAHEFQSTFPNIEELFAPAMLWDQLCYEHGLWSDLFDEAWGWVQTKDPHAHYLAMQNLEQRPDGIKFMTSVLVTPKALEEAGVDIHALAEEESLVDFINCANIPVTQTLPQPSHYRLLGRDYLLSFGHKLNTHEEQLRYQSAHSRWSHSQIIHPRDPSGWYPTHDPYLNQEKKMYYQQPQQPSVAMPGAPTDVQRYLYRVGQIITPNGSVITPATAGNPQQVIQQQIASLLGGKGTHCSVNLGQVNAKVLLQSADAQAWNVIFVDERINGHAGLEQIRVPNAPPINVAMRLLNVAPFAPALPTAPANASTLMPFMQTQAPQVAAPAAMSQVPVGQNDPFGNVVVGKRLDDGTNVTSGQLWSPQWDQQTKIIYNDSFSLANRKVIKERFEQIKQQKSAPPAPVTSTTNAATMDFLNKPVAPAPAVKPMDASESPRQSMSEVLSAIHAKTMVKETQELVPATKPKEIADATVVTERAVSFADEGAITPELEGIADAISHAFSLDISQSYQFPAQDMVDIDGDTPRTIAITEDMTEDRMIELENLGYESTTVVTGPINVSETLTICYSASEAMQAQVERIEQVSLTLTSIKEDMDEGSVFDVLPMVHAMHTIIMDPMFVGSVAGRGEKTDAASLNKLHAAFASSNGSKQATSLLIKLTQALRNRATALGGISHARAAGDSQAAALLNSLQTLTGFNGYLTRRLNELTAAYLGTDWEILSFRDELGCLEQDVRGLKSENPYLIDVLTCIEVELIKEACSAYEAAPIYATNLEAESPHVIYMPRDAFLIYIGLPASEFAKDLNTARTAKSAKSKVFSEIINGLSKIYGQRQINIEDQRILMLNVYLQTSDGLQFRLFPSLEKLVRGESAVSEWLMKLL